MALVLQLGLWFMMVVFIAGAPAFADEGGAQAKKAESAVVARIGDKVITEGEIEARIRELHPQVQEMMKNPDTRRAFIERQVRILVYSMAARDENLDKEDAVKARIEDGLNGILAQEYLARECPAPGDPTKEEMESYYKEHLDQFANPPSVRVRHILIALSSSAGDAEAGTALEKAEMVRKKVLQGESFWKLAREYSDDKVTKYNGGDLGYLTREGMVKPFADAAFSMKKGEVSEPVRSTYGFHIIKLEDLKKGDAKEFNTVEDQIRIMTSQGKQKQCLDRVFGTLKKKYGVEILP